jgi:hypothetical protein
MKKTVITTLLALVASAGQAQEIRTNEPTLDDYLHLLNAKGYMAYSFDTKDFKGKQFEPVIMEYVKGEEAKDYLGFNFSFPLGEKLVIGFAPSSNFCGEKVINPDLSSDIIKSIPHFYVLGIRII